jgi:hypothetical protein
MADAAQTQGGLPVASPVAVVQKFQELFPLQFEIAVRDVVIDECRKLLAPPEPTSSPEVVVPLEP